MRRSLRLAGPAAVLLAMFIASSAAAQAVIDGNLDASYGPALVTQTTASTQKGPHPPFGETNYSMADELDAGYGFVSNGVLHLFFAGNIPFNWTIEATTLWLPLDIFIDSVPGGQNTLLPNNPKISVPYDMTKMAGLTFDYGFTADYWFSVGGNLGSWPNIQAYYAVLPTSGGGAGTYLGTVGAGTTGPLTGGTNPYGIQVALNDSNTVGVGTGCGASSGAGVASGVELAIPLAAIGNPTGCVNVCAFLTTADHSGLFNQVLGSLPPGTCDLGSSPSVNFATIPGSQFFSICGPTPARSTTWGGLKTIYR